MPKFHYFWIFILKLIAVDALCQNSALQFTMTQSLTSAELPFREVSLSILDRQGNTWLVMPSHLCRYDGQNIDCFDTPIYGINDAFIVDKNYLVLFTQGKENQVYFDLSTFEFCEFNVPKSALIFKSERKNPSVCFLTNEKKIIQYDFRKNSFKTIGLELPMCQDLQAMYISSKNDFIQLGFNHIIVNQQKIYFAPNDKIGYQQFIETDENYLINTGKNIYGISKNNYLIRILLTDDNFCKKIWKDKKGNLILGIPNTRQCNYVKELYRVSNDFEICHEVGKLIGDNIFKSTIASIRSTDFDKEMCISSYMGYYKYENKMPLFKKYFNIQLSAGQTFGNIMRGHCEDRDGNVYFCGELDKIYVKKFDKKLDSISVFVPLNDTLKPLSFGRDLYWDNYNRWLWGVSGEYNLDVSTIFALDPITKLVKYHFPLNIKTRRFLLHDRHLILVTSKNRVMRFHIDDHTLDTLLTIENPDVKGRSCAINNDTLYFGTKDGLYVHNLKTKKIEFIASTKSLEILEILVYKGDLFLSTVKGVKHLNLHKNTLRTIDVKNGLSDNVVTAIIPLDDGKFVVTTNKGVNLWDAKKNLITQFFTKDGLCNDECNVESFLKTNSATYIGTINGITELNHPLFYKKYNDLPHIAKFTSTNYKKAPKTSFSQPLDIHFNIDDQKIALFFSDSSKSSFSKFAVRYPRIDTTWHVLQNNSFEVLRPSSDEVLDVKCTNEYGVWSETHKRYRIVLHDHFYNLWWFYPLLTFLILVFGYFYAKKRIIKIKVREEATTLMNKKISELKIESLQAQMNPHFLFNAMGSIQYFIQKREITKADDYLTRFGQLIRMILESSKVKYWSVGNEIKMLELYTSLEKERFDTPIEVEISTSNDFDLSTQIPPMIIQPFVENSFNHGIAHLSTEGGRLKIYFENIDGRAFKAYVSDNGIGRLKSNELKSRQTYYKVSRGMQITKDRIDSFNMENASHISLEIRDGDKGIGTVVEIQFPNVGRIN